MIELVPEPFDSGLWQKKVYRLQLPSSVPEIVEVRAALAKDRPDIVYAFIPFSHPYLELLKEADFQLISLRSTYTLPSQTEIGTRPLPSPFRLVPLTDGLTLRDEDLHELALIIGRTSRYFADRRIPPLAAAALYDAWIRNSLFHGYAKEAFVIMHDGRLAGLITLKIKEGIGSIDLLGVAPAFQRLGLGSHLIAQAVNFFRSQGIQDIVVVTEGENIAANAFYQRQGFIVDDLALVYHAHPSYE